MKPIQWRPRLGIFKRPNLTFDPRSGEGWCYAWYKIAAVIGGEQVLNVYRYSPTTTAHVNLLRDLFRKQGIAYREIEAPQGLQELGVAMIFHTRRLAQRIVANNHALCRDADIKQDQDAVRWLAFQGEAPADLMRAIKDAGEERERRLAGRRAKRIKVTA